MKSKIIFCALVLSVKLHAIAIVEEVHFQEKFVKVQHSFEMIEVITVDVTLEVTGEKIELSLNKHSGYIFLSVNRRLRFFMCWGVIDANVLSMAVQQKLWEGSCITYTTGIAYNSLRLQLPFYSEGMPNSKHNFLWKYYQSPNPSTTTMGSEESPSGVVKTISCHEFYNNKLFPSSKLWHWQNGRLRQTPFDFKGIYYIFEKKFSVRIDCL